MEETSNLGGNKVWHQKKYWMKGLFLIILLLIIVGACLAQKLWLKKNTQGYQAVFLTNNQVYFGKLSSSGHSYKLTDIYYLQVTQPLQQPVTPESNSNANPTQTQPNIQLVKLGSELHAPADVMYIERDQVLFWENMKDSSKVVEAITKSKAEQK